MNLRRIIAYPLRPFIRRQIDRIRAEREIAAQAIQRAQSMHEARSHIIHRARTLTYRQLFWERWI